MEEARRIYTLLSRSNGLKIREISQALELDVYFVAELMFSEECTSLWYQNDDSLWFAIEGALEFEEENEEESLEDIISVNPYDIEQYVTEEHSESFRNYLKELSNYGTISSEDTRMLFERYRDGDNKAFDLLFKSNMKHVLGLAKLFKREGVEYEDLIQEGSIGLIHAIQQFDHTIGVSFYSFAKRGIMRAIGSSQLYLPYLISIPPSVVLRHLMLNKTLDKLEQKLEYEPSPRNIEYDGYEMGGRMPYHYKLPYDLHSLTEYVEDWDNIEGHICAPDEGLMTESYKYEANCCLRMVDKRSKFILASFYGMNGREKTLGEIGDESKLTRERVRQIKEKAIRTIKQELDIIKRKKRNNADEINQLSSPQRPITSLHQKVKGSLITEEYKPCRNNGLHTIYDVQNTLEKYSLTSDSSLFAKSTPDDWLKIIELYQEDKRQKRARKSKGIHEKSTSKELEELFAFYTNRIRNIRQAKRYGEMNVAKPVLLLALIDGVSNNVFTNNCFVLNDWLENQYKSLMRCYKKDISNRNITEINYPYWHLESDLFWHLHYSGMILSKLQTPSKLWLRVQVHHASFDDNLWILLQDTVMRQRLRDYIVENKLSNRS